jgi:sec-independent protein translocase protein TatC
MANETNTQSVWEHLDVLRTAIVKIVAVAVVFGIVAFFFKEELFSIVLRKKTVLLPISYLTA